ncbi:MAG: DNA alkylation repair protein [Clostridia bacterium]|nr:DNA alkylation repair protein [Clostridia bacterium]
MDLKKKNWTKETFKEFEKYLLSLSNPKKAIFEKKIVNTNQEVLGIPTPTLRLMAKQIFKGNYLSYINNNPCLNYEEFIIIGLIISLIKDEKAQIEYLDNYLPKCDSWAHTDSLKFYINKKNMDTWFNYAKDSLKSKYTYKRRCGILVFFKLIETDYLKEIFTLLEEMKDEEEYYVNMCIAWFICDAFIKRRDDTLEYLSTTSLQKFTVNKAISKCRDSFRVSKEDKELLLKYKK